MLWTYYDKASMVNKFDQIIFTSDLILWAVIINFLRILYMLNAFISINPAVDVTYLRREKCIK